MAKQKKMYVIVILALMVMAGNRSYAQEKNNANRTLSPYFLVQSDDPDLDRLPLKSTHADVKISGVIADVKVTQVYKNEGKKPLEAVYVFPASTRAAVYGMKMTVGERTITAKIREREQARTRIQSGQTGRKKCIASGAAQTQCFSDECGQHPSV